MGLSRSIARWTSNHPWPALAQFRALLVVVWASLGATTVVSAAETAPAKADSPPSDNVKGALAEITVTATRRSQSVQDVPYNIAAIGADALAQSGITSVNGLTQAVAGLATVDTGPNSRGGNNQFSMRGLRADGSGNELDNWRTGTVAPVSTYLGETPLFYPLALKDLERVEVLKGPQGTLYGSGSLAGTIRFIPKSPRFDAFSAEVNVEGSGTDHSGQANGSFDGVINAPISGNLALRIAAGYERLGGFIDAVDLAQRTIPGNPNSPPVLQVPSDPHSGWALAPIAHDTNWSEQWYVRPVLRWKASDAVDVELSYTHERVAVGNIQAGNPTYPGGTFAFDSTGASPNSTITFRRGGPYQSTRDILNPSQSALDLGALVVTANLGAASLTSSSSYSEVATHDLEDYLPSYIVYAPDGSVALNNYDYFSNYAAGNATSSVTSRDKSFVQELRLVSTWQKPIDYVAGLYYQYEHYNFESITADPGYTGYLAATGLPGLPRPSGDLEYLYPSYSGYHFKDVAVFGDLTWHVTPKWQVTGGARFFRQEFENRATAYNYYFSGVPSVDIDVSNTTTHNDHIVKLNTSYDFTPELKLYGTYSEGFRRGGANALPLAGQYASAPQLINYSPDKSKNYEVGLKGLLLDRTLRYTVDVFFIKLDNFQFNSFSGSAFPAVFNGTEAHSKGAELEAEYQVTRRLSLGFTYAYTDATVATGFTIYDYPPLSAPQLAPAVTVAEGARLPVTPKDALTVLANYVIPLGRAAVQLHADLAYRDSAPAYIDPTSARYWMLPSATVANARVTYDSGGQWALDAFVNNLTNEAVYTGGFGTGQTAPNVFQTRYVSRPRTYGLGLHYKW